MEFGHSERLKRAGKATCNLRAVFVAAITISLVGVTSALADPTGDIDLSAYLDASIAHDFNDLPTRYRPYTTQPYYTDEGALNLGYVDASYDSNSYRGRLALQYGSSVVANYAGEAEVGARYFQEAYAGVKMGEAFTLDAGVFLSHIGLESWISRDNYTVTRALVADFSPYYQSGLRASYLFSKEVRGELHLIRGWQNISSDRNPALGSQLVYAATNDFKLTHNTFIGQEHGMRVFNNVVANYRASQKLEVGASVDLGVQERMDETTATWHGWALISRLALSELVSVGGRVERYADPHQVIIQGLSGESFKTTGLSINVDIALSELLVLRNEYRVFFASQEVFPRGGGFSAQDSFVISSLQYTIRS